MIACLLLVLARLLPASWWQLDSVIKEQAAYADYYRAREPVACPNDGEPLTRAPAREPDVILFCRHDGWQYPRDYDPDLHSGM